jgi:hypothetical protein
MERNVQFEFRLSIGSLPCGSILGLSVIRLFDNMNAQLLLDTEAIE